VKPLLNESNTRLPDELSREAEEKLWADFHAKMRQLKTERAEAVSAACPALKRLCDVMQCRSGQPYKVRALLWSLYNGKPVNLSETLNLDWDLKKDFAAVLLAFGDDSFFYDAMREQITVAGLWPWFTLESEAQS
jgi:hypothetical protein